MTVEKTTEHVAAARRFDDAAARATKARTDLAENGESFQTAMKQKGDLLVKSSSGAGVTAQEIRDVEDKARDAESANAFLHAAMTGATATHKEARDALRVHELDWFRARHAEMDQRRAEMAREADDLIETARQKLAEIGEMQDDFASLRAEADASPASPYPTAANLTYHPVPMPPNTRRVTIGVTTIGSFGETAPASNISTALGYGPQSNGPGLPPPSLGANKWQPKWGRTKDGFGFQTAPAA